MIKIDLHTHSDVSHDGGITVAEYEKALSGKLDYIAITDHGEISHAIELYKRLGEKIIVGEEILTTEGEIIALYISAKINEGMSFDDTVSEIHSQGGLVYVPHPMDSKQRKNKSVEYETLEKYKKLIDIVEVFNGRSFSAASSLIADWAIENKIAMAASSDSHSYSGLGRTYTEISETPTRDNLVDQVMNSHHNLKGPSLSMVLAPSVNRLKKKITN